MFSKSFRICLLLPIALAFATREVTHAAPCGTWNTVSVPIPGTIGEATISDLKAIAPDDVWAVGSYLTSVNGFVVTHSLAIHWNGHAWSQVTTPNPTACPTCTNVTLDAVDAVGPNDVWAAGSKRVQGTDGFLGNHIFVAHWNGSQWTAMDTPLQTGASGDLINSVAAAGSDDVWFFGEGFVPSSPSTSNPALAMHWDGSSFTMTTVPSVNPQAIGFGDGNALRSASVLSPNDIWAVGAASDGDPMPSAYSQIQHWNGSTWTDVQAAFMPGNWHELNAVVAISPSDVWAAGQYFDGADHGLAIHWDGFGWTQFPIPGAVFDLFAFASDDVYAVGAGIMHWDGLGWSSVESFPSAAALTIFGVSAAGPCDLWTGGRQFVNGHFVPHVSHVSQVLLGDLDGDGNVDGVDQSLFINVLLGTDNNPQHVTAADLNGDGIVNGNDAQPFIDSILGI